MKICRAWGIGSVWRSCDLKWLRSQKEGCKPMSTNTRPFQTKVKESQTAQACRQGRAISETRRVAAKHIHNGGVGFCIGINGECVVYTAWNSSLFWSAASLLKGYPQRISMSYSVVRFSQ